MINNKKVVVVLPAYNASKTIVNTISEIPFEIVDEIILCDDNSSDDTVQIAKDLPINHLIVHENNRGYGGNQKSLYDKALEIGADVIIMLHPDYQYTPKLITAMASIISQDLYPVVFGSRILGGGALKGGMPIYKYVANRLLTFTQNILMGEKLSEYHTGYRAYSRHVLNTINYWGNSNDFIFDNQLIAQIFKSGFPIAEITCPTKYFEEASSINLKRSTIYGIGVLIVSFSYFLDRIFKSNK